MATLVSIPLGYYTYESYRSHLRLINAPRAEAFLEDEYTKITKLGNVNYDVSYRFKVGENSYSGKSTVFNKPVLKRVFVLYDPEDPTNSVLEGGRDSFDNWKEYWNGLIAVMVVGFILSIVAAVFKNRGQKSAKQTTPISGTTKSEHIAKLKLSAENIIWLESELLNLNREIHGEDRPKESPVFLQLFPKALLENENISTGDISIAADTLVKQTSRWLRLDQSRKWDVPFSKPRVEFTTVLPEGEPGHIEFGPESTTIRIHPKFSDDPFALAAILCHELAHFILDHNGMRRSDKKENEKLTDFFVFKCGQGLIYLQGVVNVDEFDGRSRESRLGYLSLEEMAYSHVRCASQFGLSKELIAPKHFRGKPLWNWARPLISSVCEEIVVVWLK